jgi:hypothetical protein
MATDMLAGPLSAMYARTIESTRAATTAFVGGWGRLRRTASHGEGGTKRRCDRDSESA